ncbi:MAG: acetoacetate--CoA ligase [Phycisphaerae bacterium]|nr:acetoacetate--CoA ligase [Phycisphaerae bacterium]
MLTPLWSPTPERIERSAMHAFLQRVATKYGVAPNWDALRDWSIAQRDRFWSELADFAEVRFSTPPSAVSVGSSMRDTRWFPGATLNYTRHMLRHTGPQPAVEFANEVGLRITLSRDQLRAEVARAAAGLKALGVGRGDRVAALMPNLPETLILMLATTSLGAIWSSCSPDFGVRGVVDRFGQIAPKVLLTTDGYPYSGKRYHTIDRAVELQNNLPTLELTVVVPYVETNPDLSPLKNAVLWRQFLGPVEKAAPTMGYDEVPFDHPLFIMYSSGTTGIPKCIVHGHGGTLLQHMKELMLHSDLRAGDKIMYFTTCGWMMWNWLMSSLGVGAAVVLYDGNPAHPTMHTLWQLIASIGIQVFGTSPKYLAACEKAHISPGRDHDLSTLRTILSTGSPLAPEQFRWVYDNVKQDVLLASISGGTDIISCFMLGNPILPVYEGEIQCRGLGMDVQSWDENRTPLVGHKGELVCCTPFPSQPVEFWNDPDGAKYTGAYFEFFPGIWRHGDFVEITPRGGVIVYGRSDATLNPGGVRIGTAEIYRIVEEIPEVLDSLVVGREANDDIEIILFVVLRDGAKMENGNGLKERIRVAISKNATRRHVPRHIRQVSAIPYTISGKKVELAVQRLLKGEPVTNADALANPAVLDEYRAMTF